MSHHQLVVFFIYWTRRMTLYKQRDTFGSDTLFAYRHSIHQLNVTIQWSALDELFEQVGCTREAKKKSVTVTWPLFRVVHFARRSKCRTVSSSIALAGVCQGVQQQTTRSSRHLSASTLAESANRDGTRLAGEPALATVANCCHYQSAITTIDQLVWADRPRFEI